MSPDQLLDSLMSLYGPSLARRQVERYQHLLARFVELHGPGPVRVFRAPGRVNLIGEHTDYNHGYVMPVALDRDTIIAVRARADNVVRLQNVEPEFAPVTFAISEAIPSAEKGHWSNYARGAAQRLSREVGHPLKGMDALVDGAAPFGVPRGSGLSSSSSFTVVVALALATLNELNVNRQQLARLCQEAEWYTGTQGGIMDQFSALLARRGYAIFLDTRPQPDGSYYFDYARLPEGYDLVIADSGVRHSNVHGGYNHRVAECRAAVAILRQHYPGITHLRDVQTIPWKVLEPLLPEVTTLKALKEQGIRVEGPLPGVEEEDPLKVRARARHVHTENRRVEEALDAMRNRDVARLGRLMVQAHISARDDYEISCPELEALVQAALEVEGVAGARLTGAGWGGGIVALAREDVVSDLTVHLKQRFEARFGREPLVFVCQSAPAASEVPVNA